MTDCRNICKIGRQTAGLTQARWAEVIDVSVEAVAQYETGKIMPSDDVVTRMIEVAGMPVLGYWHLLNKSRVAARLLPEVQRLPLPQAVVQLLLRIRDFELRHRMDELLQISADGRIDPEEAGRFELIAGDLQGIIQAAIQVQVAREEG